MTENIVNPYPTRASLRKKGVSSPSAIIKEEVVESKEEEVVSTRPLTSPFISRLKLKEETVKFPSRASLREETKATETRVFPSRASLRTQKTESTIPVVHDTPPSVSFPKDLPAVSTPVPPQASPINETIFDETNNEFDVNVVEEETPLTEQRYFEERDNIVEEEERETLFEEDTLPEEKFSLPIFNPNLEVIEEEIEEVSLEDKKLTLPSMEDLSDTVLAKESSIVLPEVKKEEMVKDTSSFRDIFKSFKGTVVEEDVEEVPGVVLDETKIEEMQEKTPTSKLSKNKILIGVLITVLILFLTIIGFFVLNAKNHVEVPAALSIAAGDNDISLCEPFLTSDLDCTVEWEFSDTVARNHLISQSIPAGESAKKATSITLVYSAGEKFVEVPNLSGMNIEEAKNEIFEAGLEYGGAVEVDSEGKPENIVIKTSISPGTTVLNGTVIFIEISTGAFIVPDFVGMTKQEVEVEAEKLGLDLEIKEEESAKTPGTVLSQSPAAGESSKDNKIKITLAKPKTVTELTVPDVVGMSEEDAQVRLFLDGFQQILVIDVENSQVETPMITDTVPSAGHKATSEEKIVLIKSVPEKKD